MKSLKITSEEIAINFKRVEVAFLINAINEALEAVDKEEFHTLTARTPEEAVSIRSELIKMYDKAKSLRPAK